jgi:hypothetical protein
MRAAWMAGPERLRGFGEEAESRGATWTGSPKGVFTEKNHKPRPSLNKPYELTNHVHHIHLSNLTSYIDVRCGQAVSKS